MMTFGRDEWSIARANNGPGESKGFTLFELMLVLAIVAVVFVSAVPLISPSMSQKKLRAAAGDIEAMVRAERLQAQATGDRRVLEVRPAGFFLKDRTQSEALAMPTDAKVTLRGPSDTSWQKPAGQNWEFAPTGMVTPFSVRLESEGSWMEFDIDLLTGRVGEERYAF